MFSNSLTLANASPLSFNPSGNTHAQSFQVPQRSHTGFVEISPGRLELLQNIRNGRPLARVLGREPRHGGLKQLRHLVVAHFPDERAEAPRVVRGGLAEPPKLRLGVEFRRFDGRAEDGRADGRHLGRAVRGELEPANLPLAGSGDEYRGS